jgi:hypothetical protein
VTGSVFQGSGFLIVASGHRFVLRIENPASPLRNPHRYVWMRIARDAGYVTKPPKADHAGSDGGAEHELHRPATRPTCTSEAGLAARPPIFRTMVIWDRHITNVCPIPDNHNQKFRAQVLAHVYGEEL